MMALRQLVLEPGTLNPRRWTGTRRGRSRQTWAPCVRADAVAAAGGEGAMTALLQNSKQHTWRATVRKYCYP